jgi:hypothetical protein
MTADTRPRAGLTDLVKAPLRRLRADYRVLTAPLRGMPSVLIIGAQRSGTTSLFNYLAQHPDVRVPLGKEIHYFDLHYARGLAWYRGRFPYARRLRGGALTLDASPYYLLHPLAPERAAGLLPEVKLIALLRNPIERAVSHYQHEVRGGRESLSLPDALDAEAERTAGEEERVAREPGYYSFAHHRHTYQRRGLYLDQLQRWQRHYDRSRLLIMQSERLFRDPVGATATVHQFLGLRPHRLEQYQPFLHGGYDRSLPPPLRDRLAAYFAPHNRELFRWLGEEYDWT